MSGNSYWPEFSGGTRVNKHRRLSDKIMLAHEQACSEYKIDVAALLLQALELDLSSIGGPQSENREATELLEAVFDRHEKAKSNS